MVEQLSPVHFVLRTCDNRRVAAVIHANRLKKYYDPNTRPIQPPLDLDDNDDQCLCADEIPDESFENTDTQTDPTEAQQQPNDINDNIEHRNQTDATANDTDDERNIFQADKTR